MRTQTRAPTEQQSTCLRVDVPRQTPKKLLDWAPFRDSGNTAAFVGSMVQSWRALQSL